MSYGFDKWEAFAYRVDVLRLTPRLVLAAVGIATYQVSTWFMSLHDPTTQQAAFVSVVYGVTPLILNFYMQNGVDWEKRISSRQKSDQLEK